MIPKIFPPGGYDFEGVGYSQDKVEKGEAELIEVKNFNGLEKGSSKEDYAMYLEKFSSKNKRIKKPQFHATISAKGKNESFEKIVEFGHHWMEKMGYAENPYMIFRHDDTKNNHIHIVSTRINREGKKIDDSYEKIKSLEIRNNYFDIDRTKDIEKIVENFKNYSFSNTSQFRLLLESKFKNVKENSNDITFYKDEYKGKIEKKEIEGLIKDRSKKAYSEKRKSQVKNILLRLSKNHKVEDLKGLTAKYGFDLEFFKRKDNSQIFGYAIIDHKEKFVLKGSEVIGLKEINNQSIIDEKLSLEKKIILLHNEKDRLSNLNMRLAKYDYRVDISGKVFSLSAKKENSLFSIRKDLLKHCVYNEKVDLINEKYQPKNENERRLVAFVFGVKAKDIVIDNLSKRENDIKVKEATNYYNDVLNFIRKSEINPKASLENLSLILLKRNSNYYIVDKNNDSISHINLSAKNEKYAEENDLILELSDNINYEQNSFVDNVITLVDSLKYHFDYQDDSKGKGRKKQKNKGQTY